MNFTIDGASGAQAAGQGFGNMFKAAAMAPLLRQQAEVDSALKGAQIYHHQMAGNKLGTEAEQKRGALAMQNDPLENTMLSLGLPTNLAPAFRERMATGNWGGAYTAPADGVGPVMPAPANDDTLKKLGQGLEIVEDNVIGIGHQGPNRWHQPHRPALGGQGIGGASAATAHHCTDITGRLRGEIQGDLKTMNRAEHNLKAGILLEHEAIGQSAPCLSTDHF